VLSHRLVLSFDAVADGVAQEDVVRRLVEAVPPPQIAPHQAEQAA
jgi:MoxR-like ATPase